MGITCAADAETMPHLIVHGSTDFNLSAYLEDRVPETDIVSLVVRDPTLEEAYLSILN